MTITQEAFDVELARIMDERPASILLSVPGVYEAVSEHFNNEVIVNLKALYTDDDGNEACGKCPRCLDTDGPVEECCAFTQGSL